MTRILRIFNGFYQDVPQLVVFMCKFENLDCLQSVNQLTIISLCVIICLVLYALLTGATPSVIRSVIMLSLVEIGRMFYRKTNSINTLAAAAWIILVLFPADLFSVSFQLSFAAVWGILVLEPYLRNIVPMPKTQTKIGYNVKSYK